MSKMLTEAFRSQRDRSAKSRASYRRRLLQVKTPFSDQRLPARFQTERSSTRQVSASPHAQMVAGPHSSQLVRAELSRVLKAMSSFLVDILTPQGAVLAPEAQAELLVWVDCLYVHRAIGKGYSALVHNLWTVLQDTSAHIDASRLRLLRETVEQLYAAPTMSYAEARVIRKKLLAAGLPIKNRKLRAAIVETLPTQDE